MGLLAAGAATMIAGTSMGASLSDIVIKGPMAERIHENAEISVSVAEKLAKHCIDEAASKSMSVSVAVLDQYGTLTYYYRADGQPNRHLTPPAERLEEVRIHGHVGKLQGAPLNGHRDQGPVGRAGAGHRPHQLDPLRPGR
jgi:hypothetical protein